MSKESTASTTTKKEKESSYITYGEKSLYKVNKFTIFQEKFENFMYDFMDGTEEDDNLGWYRKVQLKDEDEAHKKKASTKKKATNSDSKQSNNDVKSSNNDESEKLRALNEMNKDLLDEVHALKTTLQKSNEEKESLEEELLLCYEQKENLKSIIRQLHETKEADLLQINGNSIQKKDEVDSKNKDKKDDSIDSKKSNNNENSDQKSIESKLGGIDSTWEDKVTLWKKILKGIEIDMIISSKKKACNTARHLEFIKEVENNTKQWNNLLSSFYFSTDDDIHGDYTFRDKNECCDKAKGERTSALFKENINSRFKAETIEKEINENNVMDVNTTPVQDTVIDLIGLDNTAYDTFSTINSTSSTTFFSGSNTLQSEILPSDIFSEQNMLIDNSLNGNNHANNDTIDHTSNSVLFPDLKKDSIVDVNNEPVISNQTELFLVPPPIEAPPPPSSPPPPPPQENLSQDANNVIVHLDDNDARQSQENNDIK